MVALSLPFANYLLPKLKEFFPGKFDNVSPTQLYQAFNIVQDPSFIRVGALMGSDRCCSSMFLCNCGLKRLEDTHVMTHSQMLLSSHTLIN